LPITGCGSAPFKCSSDWGWWAQQHSPLNHICEVLSLLKLSANISAINWMQAEFYFICHTSPSPWKDAET
jgi:hypothetical protein